MRRTLVLILGLLLLAGLAGCKAKEAAEQAAISDNLEDKGTRELLEETSEDSYDPPADGRLSESQVQMYLKVREKEKAIALVARKEMEAKAKTAEAKGGEKSIAGMMAGFEALGSVADFVTADIRAANELGYNTAEYQWVKERVLEASGAAFAEQMAQSTQAMMDQGYNELKKQHDAATDAETKKALAGMLAEYEKNKKDMAEQQQVEPNVKYNRELLSKYENALNALATEMSKFEEKPGDAQKALDDMAKQK
ncbi:MAG TPA: hypothetical protein VGE86_10875, partial [Thermoanaerobaculia bacterium]